MPTPSYYTGTLPSGNRLDSVHPRAYRVRYRKRMSGRDVPIDKITTGYSAHDVRATLTRRDPHGDIRGPIDVEHAFDLEPVYSGSITDSLR